MIAFNNRRFFELMGKIFGRQSLLIIILICMLFGNVYGEVESRYIPFSPDNTSLLLQRIVKAKLIPCAIEGAGLKLTITRLLDFSMDWETDRFMLACAFTAEYQGFFTIYETGAVTLTGNGLLSPGEQRLGVKLLEVEGLKFDHSGDLISEVARIILNESLSGKEFWQGGEPASSEILTKDNFATLLKVALNQLLPLTVADNALSVTFLRLDDLILMPEPGKLEARFALRGTYKKLLSFSFEGEAVAGADVFVDPEAMAGLVRIKNVKDLNLKGVPGFLDSLIGRFINAKLNGRESRIIWE